MKQTIIRFLLCTVVAMCSLNVNAQVKAFEKYADMKNVTYVFISKYMLGMAGKNAGLSVPGVDVKTLSKKLSGIQIITSEHKASQAKLKNEVKAIMAKDKYEMLMQMNEDDSNVNPCILGQVHPRRCDEDDGIASSFSSLPVRPYIPPLGASR